MEQNFKPVSIGIVGSGTAGLLAGLMLRAAFPLSEITIISSSAIGIVGVGEGSTEHWKQFMQICNIPLEEMILETAATHKYGIRFENWTTHTPDYFHSVGGVDEIYAFGYHASYMKFIEQNKLITNQTGSVGLWENKIPRQNLHKTTNQFHFDTFKLNDYFTTLCFRRMIKFVDGNVKTINLNTENGNIESIITDRDDSISADFWIDASGFNRVLMKKISDAKWNSFNEYLLCDSAIAFPTESDPNGQFRPYTRARAISSGWVWEIPTQERRGNGYVYSSNHISDEEAIRELETLTGYKVPENPRSFKFDAGYLDKQFIKNCAAVGLASAFVEPLEATSIGSTIQQIKLLASYIAAYVPGNVHSQNKYNKSMGIMMDNVLSMIRLHYMSDRRDTKFWIDQNNMKINDSLDELINLWSERPPSRWDISSEDGQMFLSPHMAHVMQGQGLIPSEPASIAINNMNLREKIDIAVDELKNGRHNHELVDHKRALMEIKELG